MRAAGFPSSPGETVSGTPCIIERPGSSGSSSWWPRCSGPARRQRCSPRMLERVTPKRPRRRAHRCTTAHGSSRCRPCLPTQRRFRSNLSRRRSAHPSSGQQHERRDHPRPAGLRRPRPDAAAGLPPSRSRRPERPSRRLEGRLRMQRPTPRSTVSACSVPMMPPWPPRPGSRLAHRTPHAAPAARARKRRPATVLWMPPMSSRNRCTFQPHRGGSHRLAHPERQDRDQRSTPLAR